MSYNDRLERAHFIKPTGAEPLRDFLKDVERRIKDIQDTECRGALKNTWQMIKLIFERENQNVAATVGLVSSFLSGWAQNEQFMRKIGLAVTDSAFGPFYLVGQFSIVLQELEEVQEAVNKEAKKTDEDETGLVTESDEIRGTEVETEAETEATNEDDSSNEDEDEDEYIAMDVVQKWSTSRCMKALKKIEESCTGWLDREEISLLAVARYWIPWRWFGRPRMRSQGWCVVQ